MSVKKKIEAIRTDTRLTEQERIWKAFALIAAHLDDEEDMGFLGAVFGGG